MFMIYIYIYKKIFVVKDCSLFSAVLPLDLTHHSTSQEHRFMFLNKTLLTGTFWYFKLFLTHLFKVLEAHAGLQTLWESASVSRKQTNTNRHFVSICVLASTSFIVQKLLWADGKGWKLVLEIQERVAVIFLQHFLPDFNYTITWNRK